MSSLEKKKRKTTTTPKSNPIASLPYDLVLKCIARVSRLYYSTLSPSCPRAFDLSLLHRSFTRPGHSWACTERCLYVSFRHFGEYLWYTLCLKPNQTLTNDTSQNMSSGYALAPVPIPHSPPANVRGLVAVGSNVYNIGSDHTWHEGPSLHVELLKNSASVLDEKINVAGFYKDGHYSLKSSFEVFDTRTQIWDPKPIPYTGTRDTLSNTSACIDGKFLVRVVGEVFAYDPKEGGRWNMLEDCDMWPHTVSDSSSCVIENVLYHAFHEKDRVHGGFRWYDAKGNKWRDLKGLVGLPKFPY